MFSLKEERSSVVKHFSAMFGGLHICCVVECKFDFAPALKLSGSWGTRSTSTSRTPRDWLVLLLPTSVLGCVTDNQAGHEKDHDWVERLGCWTVRLQV